MRDVHAIQGQNGNWDNDSYMTGMFNGIELSLAILEGREPVYRTTPKRSLWQRGRMWYMTRFTTPSPLGASE